MRWPSYLLIGLGVLMFSSAIAMAYLPGQSLDSFAVWVTPAVILLAAGLLGLQFSWCGYGSGGCSCCDDETCDCACGAVGDGHDH